MISQEKGGGGDLNGRKGLDIWGIKGKILEKQKRKRMGEGSGRKRARSSVGRRNHTYRAREKRMADTG